MTPTSYVFGGRFQPFHNDHLRMVKRFFEIHPNEHLILAIIRPVSQSLLGTHRFDAVSEEHLDPERNPLTPIQVQSMIARVVSEMKDSSVSMTLLPRLAKGPIWTVISSLIPAPRVWLVPIRGERWDEEKAAFIQEMGDQVLRIDCDRATSGYGIRTAVAAGRLEEISTHVPGFLAPKLLEWYAHAK